MLVGLRLLFLGLWLRFVGPEGELEVNLAAILVLVHESKPLISFPLG